LKFEVVAPVFTDGVITNGMPINGNSIGRDRMTFCMRLAYMMGVPTRSIEFKPVIAHISKDRSHDLLKVWSNLLATPSF